jgi:hypothetical protein
MKTTKKDIRADDKKKKNRVNKKIRKLGKVLIALFTGSAGLLLVIQLLSWASRHDQNEYMKQKACWKEIYTIIEKSPKEKAEWIKQTISNRRYLGGGVDYCSALDFIENGQEE